VDISFGPFTLDERARQLRRGTQPVHLSPKAFDLLALLVHRRPEAISKSEVHEQLWRDTFVSDVNLAVLIGEIRTALDDDARHPQFVRTVQRFGYAFSGTVAEVRRTRAPGLGHAMCWLALGAERAALSNGENLVGRDPSADVRVDAVGVSRRHAMIVVGDHEVTLHDLSSKNGTYIDDVRVTSPMTLTDGIEVRFGPAVACFRRAAGMTSTQTLKTSRASRVRP
jgi:DNA-binding winged helix-turn-helix (wHTH) protein